MSQLILQVVCYWGTWANYRPEGGKFTPEHIDPTLCTHLIYRYFYYKLCSAPTHKAVFSTATTA